MLVILASIHHQNTRKVVEAMAEEVDMEIVSINELKSVNFNDYSTIGFASGIYYWKFHEGIIKLIDELDLNQKNVFFVHTHGVKVKNYDKPLIEKSVNKGAHYLGTFGCRGYDTYSFLKYIGGIAKDRPNKQDIVKAKQFIRSLSV